MNPLLAMALVAAALGASPPTSGTDFDFGHPAIGSPVAALPEGLTRDEHCLVEEDFIDCGLSSPDGMTYGVYGQTLIRKELVRVNDAFLAPLPFGLSHSDTPATIQRKLGKLGLKARIIVVDGKTVIASPSLTNRLGIEYGVSVEFDRGGVIEAVRVQCCED